MSKQLPWRAVGDPRQACSRSRVQVLAPASALRTLFSPPSLPSSENFFCTFPTTPVKVLGLIVQSWPTLYIDRSDQKRFFIFFLYRKTKIYQKTQTFMLKKFWVSSLQFAIKSMNFEQCSLKVSIFLPNCMHYFHSYILQKTPLKLVNWFQRYEQLKDAKSNRKQKTFSALFGSILKSVFPTSD